MLQEKVIKTSARLKKCAPVITRGRAKDLIFAQLTEKRKKPAKIYKTEEIFTPEFLQTKPQGVRHGFVDEEEALCTTLPEQEIYNEPKPESSDMLIDSGHHAIVGSMKPMRGMGA